MKLSFAVVLAALTVPLVDAGRFKRINTTALRIPTTLLPEAAAKTNASVNTTNTSLYDAPGSQAYSAYLPECQEKLKAVVKKAETHYTNRQLVVALAQECDLDKEFPTVRRVFFDRRRDCRAFAEQLGAARAKEMKGEKGAYDECCQTLWEERSQASFLGSVGLVLLLTWQL